MKNCSKTSRYVCRLALAVGVLALFTAFAGGAAAGLREDVRERLRTRIEFAAGMPVINVGGEQIHSSVVLPRFYEQRGYQPAWMDDKGPGPLCNAMAEAAAGAYSHGLSPADYHLEKIQEVLAEVQANRDKGQALNPGRLADLELLLTDAFLIYGAHLLGGKVNPESVEPTWTADKKDADLAALLGEALKTGELVQALDSLAPQSEGYALLRKALRHYSAPSGQPHLPRLQTGALIKIRQRGPEVALLRARLEEEGFLDPTASQERDLFDPSLQQALKEFQKSLGLEPDGICGPSCQKALNQEAADKVDAIRVNMERWRWLPRNRGQRYLQVNIADFRLEVVENGAKALDMKAIVGKSFRKTPVFSGRMTYLVIAPHWEVPPSIAVKDKLPLIKKDPGYLTANNFKVFLGWGAEAREMDPLAIDWKAVAPGHFPFRLRQDPGPGNALGRIKFMFPNKYNVYIHDTPSHDLFDKTQRIFSSGCIRIEKPMELAEHLLGGNPGWTRQAIEETIEKRTEKTVALARPIPVHILYFTVFSDENGRLQFRNDVYDRDAAVLEALKQSH